MKIAKSHGMNLKNVGDALVERPGGIVTSFAWRDYQVEPNSVNFSVEWITKDLTYAKEFISDLDIKLIDEVLEVYKTAQNEGLSKKDWTIVNKID
jgi:3-hydroxyisobutyrate dehydrogenase